mmetsp:Transcript_50700/g.135119  ORF Transcript_50700/g.135119 Transcript_50700/m.135119 type:complete len:200 (+) Transcript_50700:248-847(+)
MPGTFESSSCAVAALEKCEPGCFQLLSPSGTPCRLVEASDSNGAELADATGRESGATWKLGGDLSSDPNGAELAKDAAGRATGGAASTNFDAKDTWRLPATSPRDNLDGPGAGKVHDGTSLGETAVDPASIGESTVRWPWYLSPSAARRSGHIHLGSVLPLSERLSVYTAPPLRDNTSKLLGITGVSEQLGDAGPAGVG